jgi:hypothetical protein
VTGLRLRAFSDTATEEPEGLEPPPPGSTGGSGLGWIGAQPAESRREIPAKIMGVLETRFMAWSSTLETLVLRTRFPERQP